MHWPPCICNAHISCHGTSTCTTTTHGVRVRRPAEECHARRWWREGRAGVRSKLEGQGGVSIVVAGGRVQTGAGAGGEGGRGQESRTPLRKSCQGKCTQAPSILQHMGRWAYSPPLGVNAGHGLELLRWCQARTLHTGVGPDRRVCDVHPDDLEWHEKEQRGQANDVNYILEHQHSTRMAQAWSRMLHEQQFSRTLTHELWLGMS
jgi:hypothetical protein